MFYLLPIGTLCQSRADASDQIILLKGLEIYSDDRSIRADGG
jgi:hypothetical protein